MLRVLSTSTVLLLWLAPTNLRAQEREPAQEAGDANEAATLDRPWNQGVTASNRQNAQQLFASGNQHFERSSYSDALAKYREAILLWNHPAIHYNMAICLMHLDQPIEAVEHLEHSLQHGPEPLEHKLFTDGELHLKNLRARLSVLRISTAEPGAVVTLDGEQLFIGPGEVVRRVLPKRHQIVASKAGMLTLTETLRPESGSETAIALRMLPYREEVVMKRRWDRWKPWAVVGGAAFSGAVAASFYGLARQNFDSFDQGIASLCPDGCSTTGPDANEYRALKQRESTGQLQNKVVVLSLAVGGAALATGLVMLYLNRPQPSSTQPADEASVSFAPTLESGPGFVGQLRVPF